MKKILFFAGGICLLFIALFFIITPLFRQTGFKRTSSDFFVTPLPTPTVPTSTVSWNDITYAYEYFEVKDVSKLTLIANFTQKKTSELLIKKNSCQYAINGGFYDTNDKPLGLFINPLLKTPAIESALVNGYLSITTRSVISFDLPQNPVIALQTGPMLIVDGKKLKLAIKNDEHARRMIAGISSKGTLLFMTIYVPTSIVQGPQLADLPDIIKQINITLPNPFMSAINLDGGNASMFKNSDIYVPEVSTVGSIFCLQE